jgi:hypothetical protein
MPELVYVIVYTIAFLLTLAAIRKSLMVTGWEWNNERIMKHRLLSYVFFLFFVVAIIAVVAIAIDIGRPVSGGIIASIVAIGYLSVANFGYRCLYGNAAVG